VSSKIFIGYLAFNFLLIEYIHYQMNKLSPKTKEDYLRDLKYHAFRKTDAHLMGIKS
jgi:hypothetical protein